MSSKSKTSSAKAKKPVKPGAESKGEDVLRAVVIADSFQDRFKPFTIQRPRVSNAKDFLATATNTDETLQCLLPLANTPLIEYTMEFLAMNGVTEVFIYCGSFTDQVEEYINRSRWATTSRVCPFSVVQFVRVSDAGSVGDILRDLDKRSLVDGDFLVVHGDLVSNLLLDEVLAAHRKRRETSAANMMTVVLRSGGLEPHRTQTNGITPVFAVDVPTQRLLHFDEMNPLQRDHYLALDPAIPDELSSDFELRADLIDAHIDICTPEVLALWSESFDYELPRRHFLHGVLKDWELNGKAIYAAILEDGYAARASNLQMYDAIGRDILGRWTFPFIPENNLWPSQKYQRYAYGLVTENNVSHAQGAQLTNVVIGADTTIGPDTRITNSFVGKGCKIGAKVVLENSSIWENTVIGQGSTITGAVVGDSVTIGERCKLPKGTIVAPGVVISTETTLAENTALTTHLGLDQPVTANTHLLGPDTNAAVFLDLDDDDVDDEDPSRLQRSLIYSLAGLSLSSSSVSTLASDSDSDEADDGNYLSPGTGASSRSRLSSFASLASDDSTGKMSFHADAVHGLLDALRADSGDFDSAKLEFMGLRLANDASDTMMRRAVATAFARRAAELLTPEHGSLDAAKAAEKAITSSAGAIVFIDEVGIGGAEAEQVEFVLALQKALQHTKTPEQAKLGTLLAAVLQQLYAVDVLEEEGILAWWNDERAHEGDMMAALRERCAVVVEWLENADEEEEDSDDDDD